MSSAANISNRAVRAARFVLAGALFLGLFLLLDWGSFNRPLLGFNITPWKPQPALAIAWLLLYPRRLPLVWLGLFAAELVVRQLPGDWWKVVVATLLLGALYAGIAMALRRWLGLLPMLATRRELGWFTGIAAVGALACSLAYVAAYAAPSLGSPASVGEAVLRYWVGDFVGQIVTLPILLYLMHPQRRGLLLRALRRAYWLPVAALVGLLLWTLLGRGGSGGLHFFYLLFIPVVLVAALQGGPAAVLVASLTQVELIVAMQFFPQTDLTFIELQVLMATITMTGLLVGVLVDERAQTAAALRESMRLATAGHMAASLAHELNQPLAALSNYARACQLLVADRQADAAQRDARLEQVARHIAADAGRAGQVIKGLRDFFRSGAIALQKVAPAEVVDEALAPHRARAQLQKVALQAELDQGLPHVWMDRLQIGIVLRNLIDNALHAAGGTGPQARVLLRVSVHNEHLLFEVIDSGAGVAPQRLEALFEAGASDKPGGMGLGLMICRAIVNAHGGRIWAESGPEGHFCFTLPLREQELPAMPTDD